MKTSLTFKKKNRKRERLYSPVWDYEKSHSNKFVEDEKVEIDKSKIIYRS